MPGLGLGGHDREGTDMAPHAHRAHLCWGDELKGEKCLSTDKECGDQSGTHPLQGAKSWLLSLRPNEVLFPTFSPPFPPFSLTTRSRDVAVGVSSVTQ